MESLEIIKLNEPIVRAGIGYRYKIRRKFGVTKMDEFYVEDIDELIDLKSEVQKILNSEELLRKIKQREEFPNLKRGT